MRPSRILSALPLAILLIGPRASIPASESPPPARLISLAPSITEILFRLGLGDRVVGVTEYCDYPPEASGKARVGGFSNPSAEKMVSLRPDLVIVLPNVGNRDAVRAVQRLGIDILVLEIRDLDGLYRSIREIGRRVGARDEAETLASGLEREVARLRSRTADLPRPSVLLAFSRDPFIVAGPGSFPGELVRIAGGRIDLGDGGNHYPRLGIEKIRELGPEVILMTRMDDEPPGETGADPLQQWKRWPNLPAVAGGRIHLVDPDTILRPGPRVVEGIRELIRILHPDAFPEDPDDDPGPR